MPHDQDDDTRALIKNAARRLFSEHGIENVSVRDILAAAGQRNIGAIGYYFQNKEALVREILMDGAKVLDDRRNALLDALEQRDQALTLRDVISIIVRPSIDLEGCPEGETYNRFFGVFQRANRAAFAEVVSRRLDLGFRRCVVHFRRLLPDHPRAILNERVNFMMLMIGASLSIREAALEQSDGADFLQLYGGKMWLSETLMENLIDACEGALRQPISATVAQSLESRSQTSA